MFLLSLQLFNISVSNVFHKILEWFLNVMNGVEVRAVMGPVQHSRFLLQ